MNRALSILGVGLLLLAASGCTSRYKFRVECTVVDGITGRSLDGVRVVIDTFGSPNAPADPNRGTEVGRTGTAGRIEYLLEVNEGERPTPERRWLLRASREGYHTEQVDVSPSEWPKATSQVMPLVLLVRLKPLPVKSEKP